MLLIEWAELEMVALLFAKQYLSSTRWEPECGCHVLLQILDPSGVHDARQMSFQDKNLVVN